MSASEVNVQLGQVWGAGQDLGLGDRSGDTRKESRPRPQRAQGSSREARCPWPAGGLSGVVGRVSRRWVPPLWKSSSEESHRALIFWGAGGAGRERGRFRPRPRSE